MINQKLTYNQIIIKTLEESGDWLPSYKLMNKETSRGWIGKSGDRRCRELAEAGRIERRLNGKYVEYRATEQKLPSPFKVNSQPIDIKQESLL